MSNKAKKGVLLVQLGTPNSPTTGEVKKYLTEFLMDPRVMDIPYISRTLLVKGIIVPKRAPRSADTYKSIWCEVNGSPLMHYSIIQRDMLQEQLGEEYQVELAMRYQEPSIENALAKFEDKFLDSLQIIPLFPQYASATTGSIFEKVMEKIRSWQYFPKLSFVSSYCDNPLMIDVIAEHATKFDLNDYDHFIFSYHGLPVRQLGKIDPKKELNCPEEGCDKCRVETNPYCYLSQCYGTSRAIVEKLNIPKEKYSVCFQSRLGKTPWIRPYTSEVLHNLAHEGKKRLLVFSPAFVADCIETLDEIVVEYANEFKEMGGEELHLVESLNGNPKWIEALKKMVLENGN